MGRVRSRRRAALLAALARPQGVYKAAHVRLVNFFIYNLFTGRLKTAQLLNCAVFLKYIFQHHSRFHSDSLMHFYL